MSEPSAATPIHVVTCFLLRRDGASDRVLLVRRSARVRTYQGAWAAVSGYLEPHIAPLDQAYTELGEEAGLAPGDVRLLRQGVPLEFEDQAIGQSWVVHPFLFALDHPERLTTDWEATASEWVAPERVRERQTVPHLADALDHVYPADEAPRARA